MIYREAARKLAALGCREVPRQIGDTSSGGSAAGARLGRVPAGVSKTRRTRSLLLAPWRASVRSRKEGVRRCMTWQRS